MKIQKLKCCGNYITNRYRNSQQNKFIDFNLSIISNKFINNHFLDIKYIKIGEHKWTISNIQLDGKRINILTGDLYINDQE